MIWTWTRLLNRLFHHLRAEQVHLIGLADDDGVLVVEFAYDEHHYRATAAGTVEEYTNAGRGNTPQAAEIQTLLFAGPED